VILAKDRHGPVSVKGDSLETKTPAKNFFIFFPVIFICPRAFLTRFYLRERTCNAGIGLSKYTGKIYLPIK
jgi:hypothetical protein